MQQLDRSDRSGRVNEKRPWKGVFTLEAILAWYFFSWHMQLIWDCITKERLM
jgi:hypothetical protein